MTEATKSTIKTIGTVLAIAVLITTTILAVGKKNHLIQDTSDIVAVVESDVKLNTHFRISATETLKSLDDKVEKNTSAVEANTKVQQQVLLELRK